MVHRGNAGIVNQIVNAFMLAANGPYGGNDGGFVRDVCRNVMVVCMFQVTFLATDAPNNVALLEQVFTYCATEAFAAATYNGNFLCSIHSGFCRDIFNQAVYGRKRAFFGKKGAFIGQDNFLAQGVVTLFFNGGQETHQTK